MEASNSKRIPADPSGRERILAATIELIVDRGVSGITLADIMDAAKLSRATIYRYFSGRQAILEGVFDLLVERSLADLSRALDEEPDLAQRVDVVFGWLDSLQRSGIIRRLLESDVPLMMELIRRVNADVWPMFDKALAPIFEQAKASFGVNPDRDMVTDILRRLHVSFALFPSQRTHPEPREIFKAVFRALVFGLGA